MIKVLYTVFIAVLLSTFVGVGIAAFYPSPKPPEFITPIAPPAQIDSSTSAQLTKQDQQNRQIQENYTNRSEKYNKNVSIIALVSAIIILIISLTILKTIPLISDGIMLGGVLTLLYSVARGFGTGDEKTHFLVVSVSLVCALALGYIKFIKPSKS